MSTMADYWAEQLRAEGERCAQAHERIGALRFERDHLREKLEALIAAVEKVERSDDYAKTPKGLQAAEQARWALSRAVEDAKRSTDIIDRIEADGRDDHA